MVKRVTRSIRPLYGVLVMKYYITVSLSKGDYIFKEYKTIKEAQKKLAELKRLNRNKVFKLRRDNTV